MPAITPQITTDPDVSPALSALFDENITRDRLMRAMGESLMEKGFNKTVVADIVKRARVSRRTFYEEFADRGECFLELCNRSTEVARKVIARAADPALPWDEQAERAVDAYFAFMTVEPRLTRATLFEVYALGDRGLEGHREVHHAFTEQMLSLSARARENGSDIRELNYATAAAVVGAIYQLIQMMTDEPPRVSVADARQAAVDIVIDSARPRD
jgi:AcrR family transcriptional regulator